MPIIYLNAPKEGKTEILREMAEGVTLKADSAIIHWKEPFKYLLKNELLEYKMQLENNKKGGNSEIVRIRRLGLPQIYDFRTLWEEVWLEIEIWNSRNVA